MTLSDASVDALNKVGAATSTITPDADKPYADPGSFDLKDGFDDAEMTKLFGRDDLSINTEKLRALSDTLQRRMILTMLNGKSLDVADSFAAMILIKQWNYKTGKNIPRLGDTVKTLLDMLSKIGR